MAKSGGGDREVLYRLGVEIDPRAKKAFEDFGRAASAVQKLITKEAVRESKQRADDSNRAIKEEERSRVRAAKEQSQREKLEGAAWRQLEREKSRERERLLRRDELLTRQTSQAKVDLAKREQAAILRTQASMEALQRQASAGYKNMAEGSFRAGEGLFRLGRAAVLLGGETESMKKFVEQLRKAQGYFDLYRGVIDIIMGLSKAYRAVAASAAAAAAAQALAAKAGAGAGGAAGGAAAGAAGAASAPWLLRAGGAVLSAAVSAPAIIGAGALSIGDMAFNRGRVTGGMGRAAGQWGFETANSLGLWQTGNAATTRARQQFNSRRQQQANLEQKAALTRQLNAPIEDAMLGARLAQAEARGKEGFGDTRAILEKELGQRRTANAQLQGDRAAGKPVAEGDILANQEAIVDLTRQKLALETQVRQARIDGIQKELEGSRESLANAKQRVQTLMDAQRTMEERWNRLSEQERKQAMDAAKAVKEGTSTAAQRDILKSVGAGGVLERDLVRAERSQAAAGGIQDFLGATGFTEQRTRAIDELGKASERTITLDNKIRVSIDANFEQMKELVAKVLKPELEKVKELISRASARDKAQANNKDVQDNTTAGGT